MGAEVLSGAEYPGGENEDNNTGRSLFAKFGGDINVSSSWLAGVSYYTSEFDVREGGGHAHGGDADAVDLEILDGDTAITGVELVFKWAPNGNPTQRNLTLQGEYFLRDEDGRLDFDDGVDAGSADYDGEQSGFYVQAVYQFMPRWRVGLRFDHLESDNELTNADPAGLDADTLGEETELVTDHDPERSTIMVEFSPSEFSLIRLQYMKDEAGEEDDDRLYLQFLMSLGSHGAHQF